MPNVTRLPATRLTTTVILFLDQVHRARQFTLRLRPKPEASNDDHRAVVAAIKARYERRLLEIFP